MNFIKNILGLFYTPLRGANSEWWSIGTFIGNMISILFLVYFAYHLEYKKPKYSQSIFFFIFLIGWMMVAYVVPNYVGQLRYRSLYFIIGVLFLVLNSSSQREIKS